MTETELRAAYAEAIGRPAERVIRLAGGAGNRIYWRLVERDGRSAVVMELPPESGKSEEVSKEPSPKDLPFLDVHRYLERIGVRVPRVFLDAHRRGFVVIEDLTDQTLEMALQSNDRTRIYQNAIDQLAKLRAHAESNPDQGCVAFSRAFDYDLYQWELELTTLRTHFNAISKELAAAPRSFTHRDYQSRNIMVLPTGEQVVIDFQDALQGPRQYDLVALLRDSYVELDRPLIDKMLKRYLARLVEEGGPKLDEREFVAFFDLLTVQRKLKDAGRFVFIDQVKKNPSFLVHIPSSLKYVKDALARRSDLAEVRDILARHVPELR